MRTVLLQPLYRRFEQRRRGGQIDGEAVGHVADLFGQRRESLGIGQIHGLVGDTIQEGAERAFVLAVVGQEFVERLLGKVPESGIVHFGACRPGDRQAFGQQPVGMQAIERRQQHPPREVTGCSEQEQLADGIALHDEPFRYGTGGFTGSGRRADRARP
jgi:hypothetical protein